MRKIYAGRVFGGPLHGRRMEQSSPSYFVIEEPRVNYADIVALQKPLPEMGLLRHSYTHTEIEGIDGRRVPIWIHNGLTLENLLAGLLSLEIDTEALAPFVEIIRK